MKFSHEGESVPEYALERTEDHWKAVLMHDVAMVAGIESRSGEEGGVREYLRVQFDGLGISTETDSMGNVWVRSDKQKEGGILLCGHMDKVGVGTSIVEKDGKVTGRLDDALGVALILNQFRRGRRPSALFTVWEETPKDGVWNAGAATAADPMWDPTAPKPDLVVVVDASGLPGKAGGGPLVYVAERSPKPRNDYFEFPVGPLKDLVRLLRRTGCHAQFVEGRPNDAIEFAFVEGVGVLAVEVPLIEGYHSEHETALVSDMVETNAVLGRIVEAYDLFRRSDKRMGPGMADRVKRIRNGSGPAIKLPGSESSSQEM